MTENSPRCGYVAIVGRPNVGKSTLLNRLVGEKISITADKPQTTRHRLLGIKTVGQAQALYVDTPGIHRKAGRALNRYMNRVADATLSEVDVVVWVVEAMRWESEDDYVLERIHKSQVPVILVINKVDTLADRRLLLPYMEMVAGKFEFRAIIPLSAQDGDNVDGLEKTVLELLPEGDPLFPEDQLTDRSSRFLAAELVREKLTRRLGAEVPYRLSVEIEQFAEEEKLLRISALIWVERPSQKSIVIGKNGHVLKTIGSQARHDMEKLFGNKVFLQLWVKVKDDWSDSEQALRELGYESNR